jgi:hypothetical protein
MLAVSIVVVAAFYKVVSILAKRHSPYLLSCEPLNEVRRGQAEKRYAPPNKNSYLVRGTSARLAVRTS